MEEVDYENKNHNMYLDGLLILCLSWLEMAWAPHLPSEQRLEGDCQHQESNPRLPMKEAGIPLCLKPVWPWN